MPKNNRNKDFPIFLPAGSHTIKERVTQQAAPDTANELRHGKANTSELACPASMEQILAEEKSVAARINSMDDTIGTRLDAIDGALTEIKTSVTTVENSLSTLSNRVADLEQRVEEAEGRLSTTEDTHDDLGFRLTAMEKMVQQLRLKVDDLENRSRRKNLKIINLPERAEGNTPLPDFLQTTLPALVGLPSGFALLEIERAHRTLAPAPDLNKPPRSVLVRFLRDSQKEAVLQP